MIKIRWTGFISCIYYIYIYIILYIYYIIYIYIILYIILYYIYYIIYIILYIYYIIHIYIYICIYIHYCVYIYMYYICILLLLCIYIYLGFERIHNCPFARFLPLGRISCEGPGNCHFLTTVVKFAFRTFWADLTLLCINKFFLDRNSREKGGNNRGNGRKYPGRLNMTETENMKWSGFFLKLSFYFDMDIFFFLW